MSALFLGLISGTSADGIDAALVRFDPAIEVVATKTLEYPPEIRQRLLALTAAAASISLDEFGALDVAVGECFADAALQLLAEAGVSPAAISAIGSHGQTVRHRPDGRYPFSLQIGDASVIAERTGICTIADFRRGDVAAGGQGAPLAPAFHAAAFSALMPCALLNLGGIANLSLLSGEHDILGFDTGPANCLLDAWSARHRGTACDTGGVWASSGSVNPDLLRELLDDPYFSAPPPKSTGREVFNLDWLDARLKQHALSAVDVQATLLVLTTRSIANALKESGPAVRSVLACGGGVHNASLMASLTSELHPVSLASTSSVGVDPDFVEAALFAWLAWRRLVGKPGNLPSVTGARGFRVLGAIYSGRY